MSAPACGDVASWSAYELRTSASPLAVVYMRAHTLLFGIDALFVAIAAAHLIRAQSGARRDVASGAG